MTAPIPPIPAPPPVLSAPYIDPAAFDAFQRGWLARDAAEQALIAELTPPTPAPADKIRWGMNASGEAQHGAAVPIYGPVDAWRYYFGYKKDGSPEQPVYPSSYTIGPDETYVVSQKNKSFTVDQFVTWMRPAPTSKPLYICPWHEYEDDIEKGHLTQAQVNALFHNCRLAQQQVGSHVKIVCCLMGFTWVTPRRDVEKLLPAEGDYDILTSDTYFEGSPGQIGAAIGTAEKQYDQQIATAARHGKTWGVTETGVGRALTGKARNDALTHLASLIKHRLLSQPVKAPDSLLGMYFAEGSGKQFEWALSLTDGSAAAWHAGQAG